MIARASRLAWYHGRDVRNSSISPARIYPYMTSLLKPPVLPRPHGACLLISLPFPAHICLYMACLLELPVLPRPQGTWFLSPLSCYAHTGSGFPNFLFSTHRYTHPWRYVAGVRSLTDSLTHALALSRSFEGYKCYRILKLLTWQSKTVHSVLHRSLYF